MFRALTYSGAWLDRAADRRMDDAWLEGRLSDPASRVVPVWRDRNLIAKGEPPAAAAIAGGGGQEVLRMAGIVALLGVDQDDLAWFAADLSDRDDRLLACLHDGATFTELRKVGPIIDTRDAALLAYARGLMYWHRRHRYCGVCGAPTISHQGGHLRRCTRATCRAAHFPRTDPAVIVLVTRPGPAGGACLLGRQRGWPAGMVSTLAGFVEPGESLEDCVVREIREEAGISVQATHYRASQPWPFPSSLMIGFRAEADEHADVVLADGELEDAAWFTRDEIARFDTLGRRLPRVDSIARRLVEEWIAEVPRE